MVIRNPFRYLSKYYKIINLILLVPMIYLLLKFGDIAKFFREYVSNSYQTVETGIADKYITGLCIVVLIALLFIHLVMAIIISSKKRNAMFHYISTIYYLYLTVIAVILYNIMASIESSSMDATFMNFIRDLANLSYLPLIPLTLVTLAKGLRFDIKSFRFEKSPELQLSEEEEEEEDAIEIKFNEKGGSATSGIVHYLRELKYYVLENKIIFRLLGILAIIGIVISAYLQIQVYNKNYSANQIFTINNFEMSLKSSFITDVDYHGNKIEDGKYFLVIKMAVQNTSSTEASLSTSDLRIYLNNKDVIYPSFDRSIRFMDVGKNYQGETISKLTGAIDYVFCYELTKDQIKSSYQIKILNKLSLKETKLITNYKIINIKPENILESESLGKASVGDQINLYETTLGETRYTIKSLQIANSYAFEYQSCNFNKVCSNYKDTVVPGNAKSLIIIEDEIIWDQTTPYYLYSDKDFYGDFVTLDYDYDISTKSGTVTRHVSSTLTDVTPSTLQGVKTFEVSNNITNGKNKKITIKVRNKEYTINLE